MLSFVDVVAHMLLTFVIAQDGDGAAAEGAR
jgi:hypothetical protein